MLSLLYKSIAKESFTNWEITIMMRKAKRNNTQENITGCLLHHDGHFIHFMEGKEELVRKLFHKIARDERHTNITLVSLEENKFPLFHDFYTVHNEFDNQPDQIQHKRLLFNQIYHSSDIVNSPGSSKIALWSQVNSLLKVNEQLAKS